MTIITLSGQQVNITERQLDVLNSLDSCRHGGFATVHGYKSGTVGKKKCLRQRVSNINFVSKFHYTTLVEKWLDKAETVELEDLDLPANAAAKFSEAKAELIASYKRTLDDEKTNSTPINEGHRAGHKRCYIHSDTGIKCNLVTTFDKDLKCMIPVIAENGLPTIASIMVSVLQINQKILDPGEYGATKHQAKTIAKNAIEKLAKGVSKPYKMLSLKDDNFEKLSMDGEEISSEDLASIADLIKESV